MATISSDTYLDSAARTAGEAFTMNGGILTVRTDTRWHANSPASMTGSLGSMTISATLGGGYYIDATKVRWMAFDGGSGTVPAIGTTVTGGTSGASGYLLGVWSSLTSAPSTVGGAMPATGFLKFREVTGSFVDNDVLSGITATANGADKTGWIEVVHDQAANFGIPRLGKFQTRGGWFYLDNTTGVANQLIQIPTNGSSTTYVPGVWIEGDHKTITNITWSNGIATVTCANHGFISRYNEKTGTWFHPGVTIEGVTPSGYNNEYTEVQVIDKNTFTIALASDPGAYTSGGEAYEYERYSSLFAAGMIPANVGTDGRSKFVCMETDGQIRIGSNGTDTVGYVPPAGRKVRVGNIFGRQCATGTRATNAIPHDTLATRPEFATTTAGAIDIEYLTADWYFNLAQAYSVKLHHLAAMNTLYITECATAIDLDDCVVGHPQSLDIQAMYLLSNFAGGTVSNSNLPRYSTGSNDHSIYVFYCKDITLDTVTTGIIQYARSTGYAQTTQSTNITWKNCTVINTRLQLTTSIGCSVLNHTHIDRYVGTTNTTTGNYAIAIASTCSNILCDGLTFNDTYPNTHPYLGVYNVGQSSNIKIRNLGTRSAFVNGGSANQPAYIFLTSGNNDTVKLQRLYMTPTRTGAISTTNSDNNMTYEHVYGDMGDTMVLASLNSVVKNSGGTNTTTGQSSVYGTHFWDAFSSDTAGRVVLSMNEPTAQSSSLVTVVAGTPKFTSAGQLTMQNLNDEIIIEQSYFVKGCTALANIAPVVTGTNVTYSSGATWGNHDIYYQIDTGLGYNGTWKDLHATNLSSETITPSTGFKLKYRIVTKTASTTNAITYIRISTTSTLTAQTDNLYPLDTVSATFSFSNLEVGTEVVLFNSSDVEIARQVITGTTFEYNYEWNSNDGDRVGNYALIWKADKFPIKYTNITFGSASINVPISQTDDLVYTSTYTPNSTIDFVNSLIIMDNGALVYSVPEVYSYWKDTILLTNNAKYDFAFGIVGGNTISGTKSIPFYTFQVNGWKVRPHEANHTLAVINGILVGQSGSDPFVDTLGAYTVRINYEQPVQAITVSTGGGGATPADIWSYSTRSLTPSGVSAIQSGLATSTQIAALNDVSVSDIVTGMQAVADDFKADVSAIPTNPLLANDTRLNNLDATISSRLDTASYIAPDNTGIKADLGVINRNVQKASLLIPATEDL